jgi:hypothetical protein
LYFQTLWFVKDDLFLKKYGKMIRGKQITLQIPTYDFMMSLLVTLTGHVTSGSHVGHAQWYILYYYYSKKKNAGEIQALINFITLCCIKYTSPWTGFELTTLMMIGTNCTGSCKSNNQTITTMTTPKILYDRHAIYSSWVLKKKIQMLLKNCNRVVSGLGESTSTCKRISSVNNFKMSWNYAHK